MSNTMEPDAFLDDLHALRPAEPDPSALVAAGYEAGRRDGAASAGVSVALWRIAAGVLLAATVGLAVHSVARFDGPGASQQQRAQRDVGDVPVLPDVNWAMDAGNQGAVESAPPLPGSYAALRASVLWGGEVNLDKLPARVGGFGGAGEGGVMRWREAL